MSDLHSEIHNQFKQELESIADMMESAANIKGDEFSRLVGTIFDLLQMADIAITALGMAGIREVEGGDQVMQGVTDCFGRLSSSISCRFHGTLTKADIDEAYALAETIHERKMEATSRIERRLAGG